PTKGDIRPAMDAAAQARAYERGGAAAISVLTEPDHFGGTLADLESVREAVMLPILRKDFLVDPLQLFEARLVGASAALIIARAVHPDEARDLLSAAREIGLDVLFEVRDERELEIGLGAGAKIIGVNNRDLESLEITDGHAERLIPLVPPELTAVAESGVRSAEDVRRAAAAGAEAVLVGSILSAASDPAAALAALTTVPRVLRAQH
ncbi:MAG: indole-3-glycerol-phosphate synthase, partial [Gemmatimonadota bacterium]|nr:indole-3-glycerol-phosphate synthase [Gemmatimonadota bacterium]